MAGLTVDDVNEMQDAMNKIDLGDNDDSGNDQNKDVDDKSGDDKLTDNKAGDDKSDDDKSDDDKNQDDKNVDDKLNKDISANVDDKETIRELRDRLRNSEESLRKSEENYNNLRKTLVDKGLITAEEDEANKKAEKDKADGLAARQEKLTEILTFMEINPKYEDVREVCAQGNLDDLIGMLSKAYVADNGGNVRDIANAMEAEIWAQPNPYKVMYELIKQYHPTYRQAPDQNKSDGKKDGEDKGDKGDKKGDKKPVSANDSAANMGPGGSGKGGAEWTAAKIDAMPEDELQTKVPKDIYEKYLIGELK